MKSNFIRFVTPNDLPAIKVIIDDNNMFPSEMLDDMIAPFFKSQMRNDHAFEQEYWFTFDDGEVRSVAYLAPEKLTEGTWNLLLIAVSKDCQGRAIGKQMMAFFETLLREHKQHLLLVETSGLPEFQRTRDFYVKCSYQQEALIRDYYQLGEDKLVFVKRYN